MNLGPYLSPVALKPLDRQWKSASRRRAIACGALMTAVSVQMLAGDNEAQAAADDEWMSDDEWLDALVFGSGDDFADETLAADDENGDSAMPSRQELEKALAEFSKPSYDATIDFGGGWKSNALLSEDGSVDSAFEQVSLDLFAHRPEFGQRWELLGILYGEYRRFDSVPDLDSEYLGVARGQVARSFGDHYRATAHLEGVTSKQAFDAGLVDFETVTQTVTYRSPEIGIAVERALGSAGKLGLGLDLAQSRYNVSSENYDRAELALDYTRSLGANSRLQFGVTGYREDYDERLERLSVGELENAPLLQVSGQRFEGEFRHSRSDRTLRLLRTRFTYETESDQVGDYYDRGKWELMQSARWAFGPWQVDSSLMYGTLDYDARRAVPAEADTRSDRNWRFVGNVSRALPYDLRAFLEFEYVDKDSNTPDYSYQSQMVRVGLSWTAFQQD